MCHRLFLFGLSSILFGAASAAQTFTTAITEGEFVSFARVNAIRSCVVNDVASLLADVDTFFPVDTRDGALLLDGVVYRREGQRLPTGERPSRFVDTSLDAAGNVTVLMQYNDGREGLFWNDLRLVRVGEPAVAPGFAPGQEYLSFHAARANGTGTVMLQGDVIDGGAATFHKFLLGLLLDPTGAVLSEKVLLLGGTIPPGLSEPIWGLAPAPRSFDLNESGEWITTVILGSFDGDGAVLVNGAIVAREGAPSPVAGRSYGRLADAVVDLNDSGDHAFWAKIDGPLASDTLLVRNGVKFVQEGDSVASLGGHTLEERRAFVRLSDSEDVFWVAFTSDPDTTRDAAFMRNREPIVQKGVTRVEGTAGTRSRLVTDLRITENLSFALSPSGRFWVGSVVLDGTTDALITADFGAAIQIEGCLANAGSLRLADGLVLAGHSVRLEMDGAPAIGTVGTIIFSRGPAVLGSACGEALPFGEALIDPARLVGQAPTGVYTGAPSSLTIDIPADVALVDLELFTQGAFLDLTGTLPGADVTLTNALKLEIGAP